MSDPAENQIEENTPADERADVATPSSDIGLSADVDLNLVLNVDVELSLEVGRKTMTIRELLQLSQGSIVELDRASGEPLDVSVNGTLIAKGEVVVVNEKYGIRLTEVVGPTERIRNVNE